MMEEKLWQAFNTPKLSTLCPGLSTKINSLKIYRGAILLNHHK